MPSKILENIFPFCLSALLSSVKKSVPGCFVLKKEEPLANAFYSITQLTNVDLANSFSGLISASDFNGRMKNGLFSQNDGDATKIFWF